MNTEIDRKIAVSLVADVVGYSKHMERDEEVCYHWRDKVLMQHRDPVVNKVNCRSTVIYTSAK